MHFVTVLQSKPVALETTLNPSRGGKESTTCSLAGRIWTPTIASA